MNFNTIHWDDLGVTAQMTTFAPPGKVAEIHVMLHVEPRQQLFDGQIQRIYQAETRLTSLPQTTGADILMKRYFLSDATNQQPLMKSETNCAVSLIQQPPLDGSKVAVWLYLVKGATVSDKYGATVAQHNGYTHIWKMGMSQNIGTSAQQTQTLLTQFEETLNQFNATIADNCIRTWFFVRDVDTQYAGMVSARRENFATHGLTEKTHYISSTGIGGLPADPRALIQLGTYSLTGFQPEQQHYLYAPTHLNPTYQYGVTFERGTLLEFGDRAHVIISGTASIDNKGNVLHVGNIVRQTQRMWENVQTLLQEGQTTFDDVMQIVVYLRDYSDYNTVKQMFDRKFPNTPIVFTLAPVCRPTWLIEMECVAVKQRTNSRFRDF